MKQNKRHRTGFLIRCLCLIGCVGLLVVMELVYSYEYLSVTNYRLESEKIKNPIRIVMMTDLHNREFGEKNQRLVKKILEQKPDLILLAGDILDKEAKDTAVFQEILKQLAGIAPTYLSYGNQEKSYLAAGGKETNEGYPEYALTYGKQPKDMLAKAAAESGAVVLEEAYTDIEVKENPLRIAGNYSYCFGMDNIAGENKMDPAIYSYLESFVSTDRYRVLMVHRPDSLIFGNAMNYWNAELAVSGHNHGGQVIFPFLGGLYGGDQGWFPFFDFGIYHSRGIRNLIITRGLSSAKQLLPRFNNPPEIVVIDLVQKS